MTWMDGAVLPYISSHHFKEDIKAASECVQSGTGGEGETRREACVGTHAPASNL